MAAVWSCNLNRSSGEVGAEAQVAARPSGGLLRCPIDGERERERDMGVTRHETEERDWPSLQAVIVKLCQNVA